MSKNEKFNTLDTAQRMKVFKMAMQLAEKEGVDAVLDAYDRILDRMGEGLFVIGTHDESVAELVEQFIADGCFARDGVKVQASIFYDAFTVWCAGRGVTGNAIPSHRKVGSFMRANKNVKDSNVVFYLDIEVRS